MHCCAGPCEDDLLAVAAGCPALTILDVEHNRGWVTERGLVALARACPQLQIVDLSDCDAGATDAVLDALGEGCGPSLKFLGVSGCGNVGAPALARLARRCPQLHELHAGRCGAVDDGVLRALAVSCPRLRLLNINDGGGGVSEPALRALVAGCPALRSLLAASCAAGVTDGLLRALAQRLPGLESLCVSACAAGVTEGALLELAAGCKHLRYLDVSYNPLVTDKAVQAVAGACSQVRLIGCDCGLCLISRHRRALAQLEWLHANLCDRVTTQGLLGAVQKARARSIDDDMARSVSDASFPRAGCLLHAAHRVGQGAGACVRHLLSGG